MDGRRENATTGIEWTEHTWNPFVGCSIHTAGCTNCYAMRQALRQTRMSASSVYHGTVAQAGNGAAYWTGVIRRGSASTWKLPRKIREPSLFFVNSMSDFFHEGAPDAWRIEALAIMAGTPHQYQILTKRPEQAREFLDRTGVALPGNAWIGATIERGDFVSRLDVLREIPAAVRYVSAEPLLGDLGRVDLEGIHWLIAGGESGPGARPCRAEWIRDLRDQCIAQGVAFFLKQWGKASNNPIYREAIAQGATAPTRYVETADPGKKGGCLLDGQEWKQWPRIEWQPPLLA